MQKRRWGLTASNYEKRKYLFTKQLPYKFPTTPIGVNALAGYIRDAIKYAKENNLPGAEWYKTVTVGIVGTEENPEILITQKGQKTVDITPTKSLFDIITMYESENLPNGYTAVIAEGYEHMKAMEDSLEGFTVIQVENNTVEFRRL